MIIPSCKANYFYTNLTYIVIIHAFCVFNSLLYTHLILHLLLGQISFFLLCLQYARAQMENLGYHPYTAWYKKKRALRICQVSATTSTFFFLLFFNCFFYPVYSIITFFKAVPEYA